MHVFLLHFACISSFGDIVLLTNLISIPVRYDTSPRQLRDLVYKLKDGVRSAGPSDHPDSVAFPLFLATGKKISSVVDEDDSKPYPLAANSIDAWCHDPRVTLGISRLPVYKDPTRLEEQRGRGI